MPEFIIEIGSLVERRQIPGDRVRIGRDDVNEIVIDDSRISREHALIEFVDGRWLLSDLGSANGTFQDEARVRRVGLDRGSRFLVADVAEITFLGDDAVSPEQDAASLRAHPGGVDQAGTAGAGQQQRSSSGGAQPDVEGYEVLDDLGSGPGSRAFLVHHKASGTAEVLREPLKSDALLEAAVTSWSRLDDPTLARLDAIRDRKGSLLMRERLARQGTLKDRLERGEKIEAQESLQLAVRLGRGLAIVHRNGIFMGLFRPSRVRLYDDAEPRIAGPGSPRIEVDACPEASIPDLRYVAPEHLRAENRVERPNAASDVYSFGALLYRLVAGCDPVDGKSLEGLRRSAEKGPLKTPDDRRPGLPEGLSELIMSCLAVDPRERPQDFEGILPALTAAAEKQLSRPKPQQRLQAKEKEAGERVASAPKRSLQFRITSWLVTFFLFCLVNFLVYWFVYRDKL